MGDVTESTVESAALAWLKGNGWRTALRARTSHRTCRQLSVLTAARRSSPPCTMRFCPSSSAGRFG